MSMPWIALGVPEHAWELFLRYHFPLKVWAKLEAVSSPLHEAVNKLLRTADDQATVQP